MIQRLDTVAWVQADDGQLTPFDEGRLADSIQRAADQVEGDDGCLAESVAAAVHHFAVECEGQEVISAREIGSIVADVLLTLGYPMLSQAYARRSERVDIRLDTMATQASGGFELGFYRQLDAALQVATDEELSVVRVQGLRACVMELRAAQRWGAGCRRLAEEIISHVRTRVSRLRPAGAESLRLAVLE